MNRLFKLILSTITISSFVFTLPSCGGSTLTSEESTIEILDENPLVMEIGEVRNLSYRANNVEGEIDFISSNPTVANVDDRGKITANSVGSSNITVYGDDASDSIEVVVEDNSISIESWGIYSSTYELYVGETATIHGYIDDLQYKYLEDDIVIEMISSGEIATLEGNVLTAKSIGEVVIVGKLLNFISNPILINVKESDVPPVPPDPPIGEDVTISLSVDKTMVGLLETFTFTIDVDPVKYYSKTQIYVVSGYEEVWANSQTEFYFVGIQGVDGGTSTFAAKCKDDKGVEHISNEVTVSWGRGGDIPNSVTLTPEYEIFAVGETITLDIETKPANASKQLLLECLNDDNAFEFTFNNVTALKSGTFELQGDILGVKSNIVEVIVVDEDPYADIDVDEFYDNYVPAESSIDAYLRTKHHLMSGDITPQDQEPTVAISQPKEGSSLIHNSSKLYSDDGDTYYVLDSTGEISKEIYKVGAYVSLEDVAAYVYAFGDVPINYDLDADSPRDSVWGEYLRWNHKHFSGDTDVYPYEPVLPRIYGCDGDLVYYEIDIGTTGTDCDPDYPNRIYNDGYTITRGAARIVYSRYYADDTPSTMLDNEPITNLDDRYVFYTYNHYNDFQEYLNYENGWGKIFGNYTAGNGPNEYVPSNPPTEYIQTVRRDLRSY